MAWSTLATAIFTGLLVWAATVAWSTAKRTLEASRAANEQAKADSIAQTRPYVFVEVVPGLAGPGNYDLRISNGGRSTARQLTCDLTAWPDPLDDVGEHVRTLFTTPRSLPPGASVRAMWRLEGNFTDGTTEAGMGPQHVVQVSYTSDDPSSPHYKDEFEALTIRSGLWPMPASGPEAPSDMNGEAKLFYKLGQALIRQVGELGR